MTQFSSQNGHRHFGLPRSIAAALAAVLVLLPTTAGAVSPIHVLKDIGAATAGSDPREFCAFNNRVYFQATDAAAGAELWVSDTTESGTSLFANIAPDTSEIQGSYPASLTVYNGRLYFSAHDGVAGRDVWVTSGGEGDATALGVYAGNDANPKCLTVANGLLFFAADRGAGMELCYTDGTSVSTVDINPGPAGSYPEDFVVLGNLLCFTADDGSHGREIWTSDGTTTGMLADLAAGTASSSPSSLAVFADKLYFAADYNPYGSQLWVSNGTAGNAQLVAVLNEPGDFALPSRLTPVGSLLYLTSRGDSAGLPTGTELWSTSGSTLSLVGDIMPGADGSNPSFLTAFSGKLVFAAAHTAFDSEPWTSDGTGAGTTRIVDINAGTAGSQPGPFYEYRNSLYFAATTAAEGRELWRTDGTTAGTALARNINADDSTVSGSYPEGFVTVRGRLVFAATTANGGREPWILDYNVAPVITEGASVPVTMSEDGDPTAFSLTLHATDDDGDTLTWSITTAAGHGTATASGTGASIAVGYTPDSGYNGDDTFVVGVDDGHGGTALCTVNVTIEIPMVTIPNVVGMTQSAAGTALTGAKLVTGTVTEQYSSSVAAGLVISQNPAAGGQALKGSSVALVVSKGPAPPITGSVVINGNASMTNSTAVTLSLNWGGGAGTGVVRMRLSSDGATWTGWLPLQKTFPYTLPAGDGYKTVRVQYLDSTNGRSTTFSDYILLDSTPPTGTISINDGAFTTNTPSVTLKLTWSDLGSGVTRMRFSDNGSNWSAWTAPTGSYAYTLPADLGYHTVRVQFADRAGNVSTVFNDYIKLVAP